MAAVVALAEGDLARTRDLLRQAQKTFCSEDAKLAAAWTQGRLHALEGNERSAERWHRRAQRQDPQGTYALPV